MIHRLLVYSKKCLLQFARDQYDVFFLKVKINFIQSGSHLTSETGVQYKKIKNNKIQKHDNL